MNRTKTPKNSNDHECRQLVILNQAANYLTIGFANSFNKNFDKVILITGSVHAQGEELDANIEVKEINSWHERPAWKKAGSYLLALLRMWWLLMTRYRQCEVLFISVPPMGYLINLILPHRFSMLIWDVYPDTLKIKGVKENDLVYRIWSRLNRWSFLKAYRIFTISTPMAEMLSTYIDKDKLVILPIWSIFQENVRISPYENPFIHENGLDKKFVVQYSGNIGLTHNVEAMLEVAEKLKYEKDIIFQIIGRGPRKPTIERLIKEKSLDNIQMLPFQSDEMFPYSLSAADLGVVILHESVSRGSVPSKSYNLMSFGIPSLYIANDDSELSRYAKEFGNAKCFNASQTCEISDFIRSLANDSNLHADMQKKAERAAGHFKRDNADRFVEQYFMMENK